MTASLVSRLDTSDTSPSSFLIAPLRSVELFVGAGGLALGLHRAGFLPVLAADSDPRAIETLEANANTAGRYTHGWKVRHEDVRSLDYDGVASPDLLSAGAPCQPFSIGGRLRLEGDERNLFPEVLRAVQSLRPRAFVLENVRGLLFPRSKPFFDYVVSQLRNPSVKLRSGESREHHLGVLQAIPETEHEYSVDTRVLNAADFGLAQVRQRLLIVGIRRGEASWAWPEPTHSKDALVAALWQDNYWDHHGVSSSVRLKARARLPNVSRRLASGEPWRTLRDLMRRLGPPKELDGHDPSHMLVQGARLYAKHTGSALDWPAKTVKAGVHGTPGGEHIVVLDDGTHRYLTVRECAALQGFPDDYILPLYRSRAMRLLGNAVPLTLAEAVGNQLAETLTHGPRC